MSERYTLQDAMRSEIKIIQGEQQWRDKREGSVAPEDDYMPVESYGRLRRKAVKDISNIEANLSSKTWKPIK